MSRAMLAISGVTNACATGVPVESAEITGFQRADVIGPLASSCR
jgi:hypothetical protein